MIDILNKAKKIISTMNKVLTPYAPVIIADKNGIGVLYLKGEADTEILIQQDLDISEAVDIMPERIDFLSTKREANEEDLLKGSEKSLISTLDYKNIPFALEISAYKFKTLIDKVKIGVSKETARPILCGICISKNKLVSVDGYRILTHDLETDLGLGEDIVLPRAAFELISKFVTRSTSTIKLHTDYEYLWLQIGEIYAKIQLLEGEYLNWQPVFSDEYEIAFNINRKELLEAINQLNKIPYYKSHDVDKSTKITDKKLIAKSRPVSLKFEDSLCRDGTDVIVHFKNVPEADSYAIPVDPLYLPWSKSKEFIIHFNGWYMAEALKVSDDEVIEIRLISSLTPITLLGSKSRSIVLPIRINN